MKEGIKKVQATGRRVQLYVSADIAHRGSAIFNPSWPASRWAQWWGMGPGQRGQQRNLHGGTGFQQNATYICHALEAWQQTVADAVARTVAATEASTQPTCHIACELRSSFDTLTCAVCSATGCGWMASETFTTRTATTQPTITHMRFQTTAMLLTWRSWLRRVRH